jgi:hypothetical protein
MGMRPAIRRTRAKRGPPHESDLSVRHPDAPSRGGEAVNGLVHGATYIRRVFEVSRRATATPARRHGPHKLSPFPPALAQPNRMHIMITAGGPWLLADTSESRWLEMTQGSERRGHASIVACDVQARYEQLDQRRVHSDMGSDGAASSIKTDATRTSALRALRTPNRS